MTSLLVSSYAALRKAVEQTLLHGKKKIEEAKVRTYWQTGFYIHAHILRNNDREDHGKQVIERLARDLEVEPTILWRCLKFRKAFPILAARQELTWAHYRALIAVLVGH